MCLKDVHKRSEAFAIQTTEPQNTEFTGGNNLPYQNQPDENLVMMTLAGEQAAFEVLVVRYQRKAIAAAMSVVNNPYLAEDAAQDAFVTAWMKLDTLNERTRFGSWICRIAKNCAVNLCTRYHSFISLDLVDNYDINSLESAENRASAAEEELNPEKLYIRREEKSELHKSIGRLPEKVREVIRLYYFENLSIVQIAERMKIKTGTVKSQLFDGRKAIRKDLCAMNERQNDTLVTKVMKKVEELKLWKFLNNKDGFEKVYAEVLREIGELPESETKNHALADVLMHGWWWIPGKENDKLLSEIKQAAELGKNEEVIEFIVGMETAKVATRCKPDFIRTSEIPYLEKLGFTKALAHELFWLGYYIKRNGGSADEAVAEFTKARKLLSSDDIYCRFIPLVERLYRELDGEMGTVDGFDFKDRSEESYSCCANAVALRVINGAPRYWESQPVPEGKLNSYNDSLDQILRNASYCDGYYFIDTMKVGESYTGSDGTVLTYISDNECVDVPAGRFEDCRLWSVRYATMVRVSVINTYYCPGVGIVKQEAICDGISESRLLGSYEIHGGEGLLPLAVGNRWEYTDEYDHSYLKTSLVSEVTYCDDREGGNVFISTLSRAQRFGYDTSSWLDMIEQIRNEYCVDNSKIADVSEAAVRAEALAKTPMEKAHTKAACSVVRRIMETDLTFNPGSDAEGYWNFFAKNSAHIKDGTVSISSDYRWSFEWKLSSDSFAETPLLYNDIYGILADATKCLWSDEWKIGASAFVEYKFSDRCNYRTRILCEDGGTVTTKAGTFENCMKMTLDISELDSGLDYRGGKKVYYFADGIGIVRTESPYCEDHGLAVYELTEYTGTGTGYMPVCGGLTRKYEAKGLTDGFIGAVEYTYVDFGDGSGDVAIFEDRTGIRRFGTPITMYSSIQSEIDEERLWNAKRRKETHLLHAYNNLNIMLHYLSRPAYNRNDPQRSIELSRFKLQLIELFGGGNGVPEGWQGVYLWHALIAAAAYFGKKTEEDKKLGYHYLDIALDYAEKWSAIKEGEPLDLGYDANFGGIKYVKGKDVFLLPPADPAKDDGETQKYAAEYGFRLNPYDGLIYFCLNSYNKGWQWFKSVSEEERFKEAIKRASGIGNID